MFYQCLSSERVSFTAWQSLIFVCFDDIIRYLLLVSINFFYRKYVSGNTIVSLLPVSFRCEIEKNFTLVQQPMRRCKKDDIAHWIARWLKSCNFPFVLLKANYLSTFCVHFFGVAFSFSFERDFTVAAADAAVLNRYINLLKRFRFHLLEFKCFLFVLLVLGVTMPSFRIILSHHQIHIVRPSKTRRRKKRNDVMAGIWYNWITNCIYSGDSDHMAPNRIASVLTWRKIANWSSLLYNWGVVPLIK